MTTTRIFVGTALAILAGGCFSVSEDTSTPASYRTLVGHPVDWSGAKWISAAEAREPSEAERKASKAPEGTSVFVKDIVNAKPVTKVVVSASGLGVFHIYANTSRIGEEVLKPGFTHGRKTKYSFSWDVTPLFNAAEGATNTVSATVSTGWWNDKVVDYIGKRSALIACVELTYEDGTKERITTGTDWRAGVGGPIRRAGIFDGEFYDARRRIDLSTLKPAVVNTEFTGEILPQRGASVYRRNDLALRPGTAYVWRGVTGENEETYGRVLKLRDYTNASLVDLHPGETLVVDFGQNAAAVPYFKAIAKTGTVLTILPGETLNDGGGLKSRGNDGPEGSVYRANLRGITGEGARIEYTFAGTGIESYLPQASFFGYRYLSFTATESVKFTRMLSIPVTSISAGMERGKITTGNDLVNRFIENVRWGQYSNYLTVPTDCPQRDERQGWTADTQVFAKAGSYNADTYDFMRKFMRDMRDTQTPCGSYTGVAPIGRYGFGGDQRFGWADCGVIVPYVMWRQFGCTEIIRENWASMTRFMDWLKDNRYAKERALEFQWGDWLSYEDFETCTGKAWKDGNQKKGPRAETALYWKFLGGCYWLMDARQMAEMARAINRPADAARYDAMAKEALAYVRREILVDGRLPEALRGLQTAALFALHCGLFTDDAATRETREALLRNIADHGDCLQTGFLGTSILMDTLTYAARAPEVAYTLLLQRKNPSWLYSVDQGATTVWERWNSYTKQDGFGPVGMNSFNHYAYGAVLAWLYETAAGIQPGLKGGFDDEVRLAPIPDPRLGFVAASVRNAHGEITSTWRYDESGHCQWTFSLPEGTRATVHANGVTREYGAGTHTLELANAQM